MHGFYGAVKERIRTARAPRFASRGAETPRWGVSRARLGESLLSRQKAHCNVLLQCAFWFDVIWVSESLQQPILCCIGVLPFCRVLISQPVYGGSHSTVDRGRRSICESRLFDCGIRHALQNLSNICIDADGLQLNFLWANCLPLVDADVGGVWVLGCHLPERVFDDNGRIVPNAQFQKEDFSACMGTEEILIPLRCCVPAFILDKLVVRTQVHGQWFPTVGTDWKKLGRYFHILLPLDHLPNDLLIIKGLLTARLTALEQTIIALRVEQALFIKASFLKAVVNIRGDDKIIFVLYQLQKINTAYKKRIVECIGWKRCVVGISDKS